MPAASRPVPLPEFIALMAMIMASVAFSVDSMLPALGEIAAELTPEVPNRAQLILTAFVLGLGLGTLITGPLSDRFGRRPVIIGGFAVHMICSVLAWVAPSLELMLLARFIQGLGTAGPRVACIAIVRDLFAGRRMAQVLSFIMMIFTLVPALAPLMGTGIIALTGWRGIFLAFVAWTAIITLWFALRQPETLDPENRRPLSVREVWRGSVAILRMRDVSLTIAVQALVYAVLFSTLTTVQPIFDDTFARGPQFPWFFAVISIVAAGGSIVNARVVVRMGMRAVVRIALRVHLLLSALLAVTVIADVLPPGWDFAIYLLFVQATFFAAGLTIGNLNALGMEPLGHVAGLGATVISAVSTVGSLLIAVPVGLAFDGTPLSLALGSALCGVLALILLRRIRAGQDAGDPAPT